MIGRDVALTHVWPGQAKSYACSGCQRHSTRLRRCVRYGVTAFNCCILTARTGTGLLLGLALWRPISCATCSLRWLQWSPVYWLRMERTKCGRVGPFRAQALSTGRRCGITPRQCEINSRRRRKPSVVTLRISGSVARNPKVLHPCTLASSGTSSHRGGHSRYNRAHPSQGPVARAGARPRNSPPAAHSARGASQVPARTRVQIPVVGDGRMRLVHRPLTLVPPAR